MLICMLDLQASLTLRVGACVRAVCHTPLNLKCKGGATLTCVLDLQPSLILRVGALTRRVGARICVPAWHTQLNPR